MEFRNITEMEKESYQEYLDLLNALNGSTKKLSEVIYDDKKYVLSYDDSAVGIIVNDGASLKPFYINDDMPMFEVYGNLEDSYNIVNGEMKEVMKTNRLGSETRLTYLVPTDNNPRYILEYSQFDAENEALLEFGYDVTQRKGLDSALAYTYFQHPDAIKFQYLKKFLFMMRRKTHYYNLTCDDNNIYVSPLIVWRENHYGCKNEQFSADLLLKQFEDCGFNTSIPKKFQSLIQGTDPEYKTLKLINKEYKNYIKGQ